MEKVFLPKLNTVGYINTIGNYSLDNKKYNVYLVIIDENNKFVHDERTQGKLEFIKADDIQYIEEERDALESKIEKLQERKSYYNYILSSFGNFTKKKEETFNNKNISHNKANQSKSKNIKTNNKYILQTEMGYIYRLLPNGIIFSKNEKDAYIFNSLRECEQLAKLLNCEYNIRTYGSNKNNDVEQNKENKENETIEYLIENILDFLDSLHK